LVTQLSSGTVTDYFGENSMGRFRKISWKPEAIVAWDFDRRPFPGAGDVMFFHQGWIDFRFDLLKTDLRPHRSFCRGELPCPVYADYLEELNVPLPAIIFDCLRGWNCD